MTAPAKTILASEQAGGMKGELQSKLVEILTSMQTAAGKASDFAMEQLPDIAQSYVAYGRAWALVSLVALVVVFVVAVAAFRWGIKHERINYDFAPFMGVTLGAVGVVASSVAFMAQAKVATLVWFAPKVWLLQEIATLLK